MGGALRIPALSQSVNRAYLLTDPGQGPAQAPDAADTVVVLEVSA